MSDTIGVGDYPWTSDTGDGRYRNPLLYADYPDPDVIADGDDFYMTVSSFHVAPGLPILHSRDLVNWKLINHALPRLPHPRFDQPQPGEGVWAPAIRKHAGKYWIFFPMPDEGIYVTTTAHPAERWSEPQLLIEGKGLIDPCPLWDDDGQAYLVHAYAASRAGIKHKLRVRPMAADGSKLLGEGQIVFDDPKNQPTLEGPKFYKRNGYYYIFAPAGGVPTGWQLAFRSRNVYGPYDVRRVLQQGATTINGPHQGGWVTTSAGEDWFIHFQQVWPYGRIQHLQPMRWKDDWPVMGDDADGDGIGEPVSTHAKPKVDGPTPIIAPATSDGFDEERLGLQWHWNATPQKDWHSLQLRKGWLSLSAQSTAADLLHTPSLLLQKVPARTFSLETIVELNQARPGVRGGVCVVGLASAGLWVEATDNGQRVVLAMDRSAEQAVEIGSGPVRLRVRMEDEGKCTFAFANERDGYRSFDAVFTAREGHWVGAKIGLACLCDGTKPAASHADFDYFRFSEF